MKITAYISDTFPSNGVICEFNFASFSVFCSWPFLIHRNRHERFQTIDPKVQLDLRNYIRNSGGVGSENNHCPILLQTYLL